MNVKLKLNIGTNDARKFNLLERDAGKTVSVDDTVAGELVKRGWGVVEDGGKPDVKAHRPGRTPTNPTTGKIVSDAQAASERPQR
jgi:hypothetical protein